MSNSPLHIIILQLLFTKAVFGGVKVSVMKGDSVTLNTGDSEIPRDHPILWTFGPEALVIAESNDTMVLVNDNDERFRYRLHLNDRNGDLTIRNMRNEHSGCYQVKIISKKATIYKRFSVTVEFLSTLISVFIYALCIGFSFLLCLLAS